MSRCFLLDLLHHGQILLASVLRLPESLEKDEQPLYFQGADVAECLSGPGYNVEKLSLPYVPQVTGEEPPRNPGPPGGHARNLHALLFSPPQSCTQSEKSCTDANRRPEVPAAALA